MKYQHTKLKAQQLQEEIQEKVKLLNSLVPTVVKGCAHQEVVGSSNSDLKVCTQCGAWSLAKLTPTRLVTTDEVLDLRHKLGLHSGVSRRLT